MKLFLRDTYYSKWNRVIIKEDNYAIILCLTALNLTYKKDWERSATELVHAMHHGRNMAFAGKDFKATANLPPDVIRQMKENYSPELVERMLEFDYSQEADITSTNIIMARAKTNGGWTPLQVMRDILAGKIDHWTHPS